MFYINVENNTVQENIPSVGGRGNKIMDVLSMDVWYFFCGRCFAWDDREMTSPENDVDYTTDESDLKIKFKKFTHECTTKIIADESQKK